MTHDELARWLGIPVAEVATWKASHCERDLEICNELARAMRPKADAGDRRAAAGRRVHRDVAAIATILGGSLILCRSHRRGVSRLLGPRGIGLFPVGRNSFVKIGGHGH